MLVRITFSAAIEFRFGSLGQLSEGHPGHKVTKDGIETKWPGSRFGKQGFALCVWRKGAFLPL